jgi:hypothetical protein
MMFVLGRQRGLCAVFQSTFRCRLASTQRDRGLVNNFPVDLLSWPSTDTANARATNSIRCRPLRQCHMFQY